MEESLALTTQQRLQQRLTPLQVQYVRMLEMSGPEVEDEIRRAVDENPALEVVEDQPRDDFNESAEQMRLADYRDEDDIPSYRLEARNHSADDEYVEPTVVDDGDTLMDHLMRQIAETSLDDVDRQIAQYIIGNIDDNGYLARELPAIADDLAILGIDRSDPAHVREILNVVRSLDPAGVGAVDLRDSLLLQLQRRAYNPDRPMTESEKIAIEIVRDYFDLFSKKHYDRLAQLMNIDHTALKEAIDEIRALNPKPGNAVATSSADDKSRQITPEFSVEVGPGDQLTLTVLNSIPELQIERSFAYNSPIERKEANDGTRTSSRRDAALFIRQKRDEAASFIKIVELRQTTLSRVMEAIIKLQRDFFLTGDVTTIRPMILKDIAALTGYDLSVISRATSGKYVLTQYGVFPLKMFFNERPKDDDDTSSHQIIAAIRGVIDGEDKRHPLSDETITSRLRDRGFDIARRTVAKYREKLGIPVARLRREVG